MLFSDQAANSNIDPLTDLPDSSAWNITVQEHKNSSEPIIIMSLDIKDLKKVNSEYGFQVGNISLIATADIIKSCLRPDDFVARTGEDDFGVLLSPGSENPEKLIKIIGERLLNRILDYNSDHQVPVSLDIGGAFSSTPPHNLEKLLSDSKKIMFSHPDSRSLR